MHNYIQAIILTLIVYVLIILCTGIQIYLCCNCYAIFVENEFVHSVSYVHVVIFCNLTRHECEILIQICIYYSFSHVFTIIVLCIWIYDNCYCLYSICSKYMLFFTSFNVI